MSDAYPADSVASIEPELMRPALKKYGEILVKMKLSVNEDAA